MARCSGMRLWLITGLGLTLIVPSGTASAQIRSDEEFYSLLIAQTSGPPTAPAKAAAPGYRAAEVAEQSSDPKGGAASLMTAAEPDVQRAALPVPRELQHNLVSILLSLSPITWAMIFAGIVAFGVLLWSATPLPCLVLGHRRASRSIHFNADEQRWVGHCKSCGAVLARREGVWKPAEPTWRNPEVLQGPAADHLSRDDGADAEVIEWPLRGNCEPQSNDERLPVEQRSQAIVSRLVDDAATDAVPTPGTRGALFSVVDELRARCTTDEWTLCAEKISIRMRELERALQGGDEAKATLSRSDLENFAGNWMGARTSATAEAD